MLQSQKMKFTFESKASSETKFSVVRFKGVEGLSTCYMFTIVLATEDADFDLRGVLDSPATFTILHEEGDDLPFHGYVIKFEELQRKGKLCFYRAQLAPRFWWLSLTRHNQIMLDKSLTEALEIVLNDGGLTPRDYRLSLRENYPKREYICQYEETHLNFVSRWMEWAGMYYFFEQGPDTEVLVITDTLVSHDFMTQGREMVYSPPSGLEGPYREHIIDHFYCTQRKMPNAVVVRDYNYETPNLELLGHAEVSPTGLGSFYHYGDGVLSPSEAQKQATLRAQELNCKEKTFQGSSTIPFLRPGYLFTLTQHYRQEFNREYMVVEVKHEGSQAAYIRSGMGKASKGSDSAPVYQNNFTCIPADIQFRPERTHQMTRISGYLPATVDAHGGGQYAQVDEQGRYKVIMPFDLSGRGQGKASAWIRKAQPYTGAGHGMHFPLHKGTEVALGFVGGNPDLPVIGAALPNPNVPSIINTQNQTMAGFCSGSGGGLNLEDAKGHERMVLHSGNNRSFMKIGSGSDDEMWMANDNVVSATTFCSTCFTGEFAKAASMWKISQMSGGLKTMLISAMIKDVISNAPTLAANIYKNSTGSGDGQDSASKDLGCASTALQPVIDMIADIITDKFYVDKQSEKAANAMRQLAIPNGFSKNYNGRYNFTITAMGETNTFDQISTMTKTNYYILNSSIAAQAVQAGVGAGVSNDQDRKKSADQDGNGGFTDSETGTGVLMGATAVGSAAGMAYKQLKWKKEFGLDNNPALPDTKRQGIGLISVVGPIILDAKQGDICLDTRKQLQVMVGDKMSVWGDDIAIGSKSIAPSSPLTATSNYRFNVTTSRSCIQAWDGLELSTGVPGTTDYEEVGTQLLLNRLTKTADDGIRITARKNHNIFIRQEPGNPTAVPPIPKNEQGIISVSSNKTVTINVGETAITIEDGKITIQAAGDDGISILGPERGALTLDKSGCSIQHGAQFNVGKVVKVDTGLDEVLNISSGGTTIKGSLNVGNALRVKGDVVSMTSVASNRFDEIESRLKALEQSGASNAAGVSSGAAPGGE